MQNTVAICRYGTKRTLTYAHGATRRVFQRNTVRVKNSIGKVLSYEIDGKKYKVLGPGENCDIASLNTSEGTTYWKVCPKTKKIIGQY